MTSIKIVPSPLPAVLVCTLGIFVLSAMDASVKALVVVIGAYNTLLWRSILATATAGSVWAALSNRRPSIKAVRLHAVRGVIVSFVALAFFFGLGRLPLAEAIALSFVAPLVALFLAALMLKERISRTAVGASLIGMAGVLVIMFGKLGQSGYAPDALLGMAAIIASAVLYAYNLILARQQALVAKPLEIVFFQNLVVGITLGLASPWLGTGVPQDQWPLLVGVTALALAGHFLMSWAYARAEAQYLIPTEYSAFVWAIMLGWIFFQESVSWSTMAGALLIIAGCLIASRAKPKLVAEPIEAAAV